MKREIIQVWELGYNKQSKVLFLTYYLIVWSLRCWYYNLLYAWWNVKKIRSILIKNNNLIILKYKKLGRFILI